MPHRVALIGNNSHQLSLKALLAERGGFDVVVIDGGNGYEDGLAKTPSDIVIVDEDAVSNSWQMCSKIRSESAVPIIMVGHSDNILSWAKAAKYGVEFYAKRPIQPLELIARIRALLRRYEQQLYKYTNDRAWNTK